MGQPMYQVPQAYDISGAYNANLAAARQAALAPRLGQIAKQEADDLANADVQEAEDVASSNSSQRAMLNNAALASERRRAGGTTFRRRGSATTANQLVSGLGTANARNLANVRRSAIQRRSAAARSAAESEVNASTSGGGGWMLAGPAIGFTYG